MSTHRAPAEIRRAPRLLRQMRLAIVEAPAPCSSNTARPASHGERRRAGRYASRMIVTGPSFESSTSMRAPKTPVSTGRPARAAPRRSARRAARPPRASGAGEARASSLLAPLSARSVNWLTTSASPADVEQRAVEAALVVLEDPQPRDLPRETLGGCGRVLVADPRRTSTPRPQPPTCSPSTLTDALDTLCTTARTGDSWRAAALAWGPWPRGSRITASSATCRRRRSCRATAASTGSASHGSTRAPASPRSSVTPRTASGRSPRQPRSSRPVAPTGATRSCWRRSSTPPRAPFG